MKVFYNDELFWKIKSLNPFHPSRMISTFIRSRPKLYTHGFFWESSCLRPKKLQRDVKKEFQYKHWVDVTDPTQLPDESGGIIIELDVQFADEETERLYRAHEETIDLHPGGNTSVTFKKYQSFDSVYTDEPSITMKRISFIIHLVFIILAISPIYHVISKVINWKNLKHVFFKRVVIKKVISSKQAPHRNI